MQFKNHRRQIPALQRMNFRRLGQLRSLNSKQLDSTVVGRYGQVVRALAECEGLDASSNSAVGKNGSAQK